MYLSACSDGRYISTYAQLKALMQPIFFGDLIQFCRLTQILQAISLTVRQVYSDAHQHSHQCLLEIRDYVSGCTIKIFSFHQGRHFRFCPRSSRMYPSGTLRDVLRI